MSTIEWSTMKVLGGFFPLYILNVWNIWHAKNEHSNANFERLNGFISLFSLYFMQILAHDQHCWQQLHSYGNVCHVKRWNFLFIFWLFPFMIIDECDVHYGMSALINQPIYLVKLCKRKAVLIEFIDFNFMWFHRNKMVWLKCDEYQTINQHLNVMRNLMNAYEYISIYLSVSVSYSFVLISHFRDCFIVYLNSHFTFKLQFITMRVLTTTLNGWTKNMFSYSIQCAICCFRLTPHEINVKFCNINSVNQFQACT